MKENNRMFREWTERERILLTWLVEEKIRIRNAEYPRREDFIASRAKLQEIDKLIKVVNYAFSGWTDEVVEVYVNGVR
jgi:hypothetical protein